jgi:ligand-binding sensor domain-containing protein
VTVFNPAPGGGTSNSRDFTVNNPVPTLDSLVPPSATAGGPAFTLTAYGTGFVQGSSVVRWNAVDGTYREYSPAEGAPGNCTSMLIDKKGNKWFTARSAAGPYVSKFDASAWTSHTNVSSVRILDSSGGVWFGTPGKGLAVYDGTSWRYFDTTNGLPSSSISYISTDSRGTVWGVTPKGVAAYDGLSWTLYDSSAGLAANTVRGIAVDRFGNAWFATAQGLSRYDGTTWRTFPDTVFNTPLLGDLRCMTVDAGGSVWVSSTWNGVWKFDGSQWILIRGYVLPSMISVEPGGRIWFLSDSLCRYEADVLKAFAITCESPTTMLFDGSGNVWIGTYGYNRPGA